MNGETMIEKFNVLDFRNPETEKYSVWVYDGGEVLQVFREEQPNTEEVWFRFYKFNHFYWKMLEDECIEEIKGSSFYSFSKLKMFMIRRMLCATSIDGIDIEYDSYGMLKDECFDRFMQIHPRILRVLMDKMDILPKPMPKSEEKELEKQCSILFGKGEGVTNPHEYIAMYCNLMASWDKFGMNYFDLLKLPQDVFSALKRVMSLDNTHKSEKMNDITRQNQQRHSQMPQKRGTRSVRF